MKKLEKINILFVEENEDLRKRISSSLDKYFSKVYEAKNGKEAITILDEKCDEISLAIIDLHINDMDGFDLVELIKTNFTHIKVILTAEEKDSDNFIKAIKLKVEKFFLKPYNEMTLLEDCKLILDSKLVHNAIVEAQNINTNFEEILENLAFVVRFNTDKKITHINNKFFNFLEYSKNEILELGYDFLSGDLLITEKNNDLLWDKIVSEKYYNGKIAYYSKSRNLINLNISISPIYEKEMLAGFVLIGYSINHLEDAKKKYKNLLFTENSAKTLLSSELRILKANYAKLLQEQKKSHETLSLRKEFIQKQYETITIMEEYASKIDKEFVSSLQVQQKTRKKLLKKELDVKMLFEENKEKIEELEEKNKAINEKIKIIDDKINKYAFFKNIDKKQQILITNLKKEIEMLDKNV